MQKTTTSVVTGKRIPVSPILNHKAVRILRKVQHRILADPSSYRQDNWHCGTAACIAGHVCLVDGAKAVKLENVPNRYCSHVNYAAGVLTLDWGSVAADILGVVYGDVGNLFGPDPSPGDDTAWPHPFNEDWRKARSRKAKAQVAARRIDYFITEGR